RVVAGVPEPRGEHGLIGVVELHADRAALLGHREVAVEAAVAQAEVLEEPERLAGEVAQLRVLTLGLELPDHRDRQDHVGFGEAGDGPRIGQQTLSGEDAGTSGVGHGELLARGTRGRVGMDRSARVARWRRGRVPAPSRSSRAILGWDLPTVGFPTDR